VGVGSQLRRDLSCNVNGVSVWVFFHEYMLKLTVLSNQATSNTVVSYILCFVEMRPYAVCEPPVLKAL